MKKIIILISFVIAILGSIEVRGQVLINSYAFASETNSMITPDLVSLWDSSSIDPTATTEGDDINTWSDAYGSNDATQTLTSRPKLHIASDGDRQVRFDGGDDWLNVGTPSNLNFVGNTDAFSCVIKTGEVHGAGANGYWISKASATGSTRNYGFYDSGSGAEISFVIGGTNTNIGTAPSADDLIIFTITSGGAYTIRINGTESTGTNAGSNSSDVDINIGGRSNGGYTLEGDIQMIGMYNDVLTAGEISAIETQYLE